MPRVTAIIATYNWSEVLPYSIGSVLDQTFTDFELIVAGDCCTDNSADVVQAYDDPRVTWLNLAVNSKHQYGPNNAAIAASDSDLIAYLGHDDLWLPHHLDMLVGALTGGPGVAHSSGLYVLPGPKALALPNGDWAYRRGTWLAPTTVAHSRSLVEQFGGWRPPWETGLLDPDAELCTRLAAGLGHPPTWVRNVTAVKLPADRRRDVYVDRPCHEQHEWLERIRAGERWDHLITPPSRLGQLRATTRNRLLDALPQRVVSWSAGTAYRPSWMIRESAERRWLARREKKGLDRVQPR
jgi:glycosyltransferase involved in cell wall biosynthesis